MTAGAPAPVAAVGDLVELDVERVATGGVCVARLDGVAVFVRHTLPGERVQARITEVRPRYLRADAVAVREASPDRVVPPCPYAGPGLCGGCDWQHVALPRQRLLKEAVVREQLERLGGLDPAELPDFSVEAVPGDAAGLGWRTRVGFAVRRDGVVGLHRHRSDTVQPVEACLIAAPSVDAVGVTRERWPGVRAVEVEAPASGDGAVVVVTPARRGQVQLPPLDDGVGVARRPSPRSARVEPVDGPQEVREVVAGREFRVRAGGFWQVHPGAATVLAETVVAFAAPRPGERAVDLYAGAGPLAAALADAVGPSGTVLAVEGDFSASQDARAALADLPQVRVAADRVTPTLPALDEPWDVVVLDPPRSGAGEELTRRLLATGARAVVYVACDPAALARDVAVARAAGWRLTALRGLDLFPMTQHVEVVARLEPPA